MSESQVLEPERGESAAMLEERLRRAETLARIASQVNYERPLVDVLESLAHEIVAESRAVAASLVLLDAIDFGAVAYASVNLPEGYGDAMIRARQDAGNGDLLREAVLAGKTWVIPNAREYLSAQPEYAGMLDMLQRIPYDTLVANPFQIREDVFGVVYLYYPPGVEVDQDEANFQRAIAERTALAMDNALLFSETQRRAAELEALNKADEALLRSLRLEDVMDAMVEFAIELLGADSGLVVAWGSDDKLTVQAIRGLDDEYREMLNRIYGRHPRDRFVSPPVPATTNLVPDISQQPTLVERMGDRAVGALAEVPVFIGNEFWGLFNIGWSRPRTFSEVDRRLFDTFASRASIAIQNALLFSETQRRTAELEALHRADEALHRSLDIDDVVEAMAELTMELLGADSSLVATWDENDELAVKTSRGIRPNLLAEIDRVYRTFPHEQFADAEPLQTSIVEDISKVPVLVGRLGQRAAVGAMAEVGIVLNGEFWGVFSIGWLRPRRFSAGDRRLLAAFASRASLAIQNAILFERAQEAASMEERQRLARDLHDSVSQALYGIGLGARTAKKRLAESPPEHLEPIDYIIQLAESGLAETRALIFELVPESLAEQGLVLALQRLASLAQARHTIAVSVTLCDEPSIPVKAKEALYRIAQESLNNIGKHAHASEVTLALTHGDTLTLTIRDNGRGFDPAGDFPGHFGLRSMEERASNAGGAFGVESRPGKGTTVTVALPISGV